MDCESQSGDRRAGQAMVESVVVMLVACLLFFGLFQLAHGFARREVLRHAAARAARARAVGFNHWMVTKVMRAAAIPNAGRMVQPETEPGSPALRQALAASSPGALWDWALTSEPDNTRAQLERARIPDYLASENHARATYILDYADWTDVRGSGLGGRGLRPIGHDTLEVGVRQRYPLSIMVRALYDWTGALMRDEIDLRGAYTIENHYPLYLDDRGL